MLNDAARKIGRESCWLGWVGLTVEMIFGGSMKSTKPFSRFNNHFGESRACGDGLKSWSRFLSISTARLPIVGVSNLRVGQHACIECDGSSNIVLSLEVVSRLGVGYR